MRVDGLLRTSSIVTRLDPFRQSLHLLSFLADPALSILGSTPDAPASTSAASEHLLLAHGGAQQPSPWSSAPSAPKVLIQNHFSSSSLSRGGRGLFFSSWGGLCVTPTCLKRNCRGTKNSGSFDSPQSFRARFPTAESQRKTFAPTRALVYTPAVSDGELALITSFTPTSLCRFLGEFNTCKVFLGRRLGGLIIVGVSGFRILSMIQRLQ